jgi:cell division transport system permease protein
VRPGLVVRDALVGLWRNATMTVAAVVTVAFAMTALGGALVIRSGIDTLRHELVNADNVSVGLLHCGPVQSGSACPSRSQQRAIQEALQAIPQVTSVVFVSQPDAYQRFSEMLQGGPVPITKPTLPPFFSVQLVKGADADTVRAAALDIAGVGSVDAESPVTQPIFRFLNRIAKFANSIALAFLLLSVLLIYTCMVVAAFTGRKETRVMQLVGASDRQIRGPFIIQAAITGLLGSLAALCVMLLSRRLVDGSAGSTLFRPFGQWPAFWHAVPDVLIAGPTVAAIAASLALRRHLRT